MPINIDNFVSITSSVQGGSQVARRNLVARLFTDNDLVNPGGEPLKFNSAAAVGVYFGLTSAEYLRAVFYFGFISKDNNSPQQIQFAKWAKTAEPPRIYGNNTEAFVLADWQAISAGTLTMTLQGDTEAFTAIDFSSDANETAVAATLQTKIRTGTGTKYTNATVVWNATRGSFDFASGDTGAGAVTVDAGTVGAIVGWTVGGDGGTGLVINDGSAIETITAALTNSDALDNDFGSFTFMPTLTSDEVKEAAIWNDGKNFQYLYSIAVSTANVSTYKADLVSYSGWCYTLANSATEYPEMLPMAIEAATNYDAVNSVQNYMFQQVSGLTAEVTTDAVYTSMVADRVNFYGQTQEAGTDLSFYMEGVMGNPTNDIGINVYVNELWLKDAATAAFMNLLLNQPEVPANNTGRALILNTLQDVVNDALNNGVISVGKTLTAAQRQYVTDQTGDANAYQQVQSSGYWVGVTISGTTATYRLIYSKDDVIRKVEGSDELI